MPDLDRLRERLGDDPTTKQYISMFLREMPDILHQMEVAISASQWEESSRWAHIFRTQMLMISHTMAVSSSAQIESECKTAGPDESLVMKEAVKCRQYLDETIEILKQVTG